MSDTKDDTIKGILQYKVTKYIISVLLVVTMIIVVWEWIHHQIRCAKGLNNKLFWGMSECLECKIIDSIRHDTIWKKDTVWLPAVANNQVTHSPKTAAKSDEKGSKFNLQNPTFSAPSQIGDHNTQNFFGRLEPHPSPALLESFQHKFQKEDTIRLAFNNLNRDARPYVNELTSLLKARGYKNVFQVEFATTDEVQKGAHLTTLVGQNVVMIEP